MRATRAGLGCVLALLLGGPAVAADLAVRPGLWEVTDSDALAALLAGLPKALAGRLAPEQQAGLQQRLATLGIGGGPGRVCVTPVMLHRPLTPISRHGCTATPTAASPTEMTVALACTGAHRGQGSAHLLALDPQTVTGEADGQIDLGDGTTVPLRRTFRSRWIAADCGSVKPLQ